MHVGKGASKPTAQCRSPTMARPPPCPSCTAPNSRWESQGFGPRNCAGILPIVLIECSLHAPIESAIACADRMFDGMCRSISAACLPYSLFGQPLAKTPMEDRLTGQILPFLGIDAICGNHLAALYWSSCHSTICWAPLCTLQQGSK